MRKAPDTSAKQVETPSSIDIEAPRLRSGPLTNRLLESAYEEWIFFDRQKVVYTQDEESIPHVGMWEDEDFVHSNRVADYWRAVGLSGLNGNDCSQAWSAAFISWLMVNAGVPESQFLPAISHGIYLARIVADAHNPDAVFIPHTIREYPPKPGDLICASRENSLSTPSDQLPQPFELETARLHCDVVTETAGSRLKAIGGNVRNSVSMSILTLSPEGRLQPTRRRPWFLVIENRLD